MSKDQEEFYQEFGWPDDELEDDDYFEQQHSERTTATRVKFGNRILFVNFGVTDTLDRVIEAILEVFDVDPEHTASQVTLIDRFGAEVSDGRTAIASGAGGWLTASLAEVVDPLVVRAVASSEQGDIVTQWAETLRGNQGLQNLFVQLGSQDSANALAFVRLVNAKIKSSSMHTT